MKTIIEEILESFCRGIPGAVPQVPWDEEPTATDGAPIIPEMRKIRSAGPTHGCNSQVVDTVIDRPGLKKGE